MVSIYKYLAEEAHARALIDKGQMYLRSLAHFRGHEDGLVRGDPEDGQLSYQPESGLVVNNSGGQVLTLPPDWRFKASVRSDDIYVYCLSQERSEALAERFESQFCVEIRDPGSLLAKAKGSARLRARLDPRVYSGPVEYRDPRAAADADWALPAKVAFIKPPSWSWQNEYRYVIGRKGAFAPENVQTVLESGVGVSAAAASGYPLILAVGDLSSIAQLHQF